MMTKYNIYTHEKSNPEADVIFICSCYDMEMASYIVETLEYRDTCGKCNDAGMYDYYIKSE